MFLQFFGGAIALKKLVWFTTNNNICHARGDANISDVSVFVIAVAFSVHLFSYSYDRHSSKIHMGEIGASTALVFLVTCIGGAIGLVYGTFFCVSHWLCHVFLR